MDSGIGSGSKTVCVLLRESSSQSDPDAADGAGLVAPPAGPDGVDEEVIIVSVLEVPVVCFSYLDNLGRFPIFWRLSVPRPSALHKALSKVESCSSLRYPTRSLQVKGKMILRQLLTAKQM